MVALYRPGGLLCTNRTQEPQLRYSCCMIFESTSTSVPTFFVICTSDCLLVTDIDYASQVTAPIERSTLRRH